MPKSEQAPSIGRVVIYVPKKDDLECRYNRADKVPAIIVRTWENTSYENDEVNLKVLTDSPRDHWRTSVPHDPNGAPGTWHWPSRV